jgi:hypothetical protein
MNPGNIGRMSCVPPANDNVLIAGQRVLEGGWRT